MSKLKEFTTQAARPLPVVVLADVSATSWCACSRRSGVHWARPS